MTAQHIVKSYDEELKRLTNAIVEMGGAAESQLAQAIQAVAKRDSELAGRVVRQDAAIDHLEEAVQSQTMRLLALRQPVARDLRDILAAIKIASDIERIGDLAANIAKRAIALNQTAPVRPVGAVPRMGRLAQQAIKDVIDAYVEQDAQKAIAVWQRDDDLDDLTSSLFRELLTYMMEDPRSISPCAHLLFIAKNIERIGDHATNIAETVHFLVLGQRPPTARPKGDTSSYAVVEPPPEGPAGNPPGTPPRSAA
jgi:phosphate transport system protein